MRMTHAGTSCEVVAGTLKTYDVRLVLCSREHSGQRRGDHVADVAVGEGVARRLERGRSGVDGAQQLRRHSARRPGPSTIRGDRQPGSSPDRVGEGVGELGVGRRLRAAQVEHPGELLVARRGRLPRRSSPAARSSGSTAGRRRAGCPARAGTSSTICLSGALRPVHAPARCAARTPGPPPRRPGCRGRLPLAGHPGEQGVAAAVGVLGEHLGTVVAVEEMPLPARNAGFDSLPAIASASTRVVVTLLLAQLARPLLGVRVAGGRRAGEVDDDVGGLDHVGGRRARRTGPTATRRRRRGSPDQPHDLVARRDEALGQVAAEEPRRPGDDDRIVSECSRHQTSNWPDSRRALTSDRNRAASAPSTRRWS